jgi:NAD(P)H dehydrogenase (quinone)
MMNKPRILVTSAAGRTGSVAVLELLRKGFPVRAFVRRNDVRSETLRKAGAEIFVGDLFDLSDLRTALVDVQRAYHCPPFVPNLLHGTMLFALAAEEAKLEVVALMSGWNPHPTHPTIQTREHWIANNIYRWMPTVDVIHINPGIFAFMYLLGLPAIVHFGMLVGPWGDGLNAPPSSEDIGSVAAGVLADPSPHIGKRYRPTGPKLISPHDVAAILTDVVGRKVRYQDVSSKMFLKAAKAQGVSDFEIGHIGHYFEELRGGTYAVGAPTNHVQEVLGRPPESFETAARRYIAQPDLIATGLRAGTKLEALAFMVKMMLTRAPDPDRWARERGHPILREPVLAHDSRDWREAAEQKDLLLLPTSRTQGQGRSYSQERKTDSVMPGL